MVVLVANDISSANDLSQREDSENLDSSDKELDGVVLGVSLNLVQVVLWSLERVKTKSFEGLKDSLELRTSRRCKTFLNVYLLSELSNDLRPENSLGDKG